MLLTQACHLGLTLGGREVPRAAPAVEDGARAVRAAAARPRPPRRERRRAGPGSTRGDASLSRPDDLPDNLRIPSTVWRDDVGLETPPPRSRPRRAQTPEKRLATPHCTDRNPARSSAATTSARGDPGRLPVLSERTRSSGQNCRSWSVTCCLRGFDRGGVRSVPSGSQKNKPWRLWRNWPRGRRVPAGGIVWSTRP